MKNTRITLKPGDAALIVRKNMKIEGCLPHPEPGNEEALVPDSVRIIAGLMILLNDEEDYEILMDMINTKLSMLAGADEDAEEGC
jgi:hypothetical protein